MGPDIYFGAPRGCLGDRAITRASSLAAKSVPQTKYMRGPKAPTRWRAQEMQPGDRGFEAGAELREPIGHAEGLRDFGRQERVARNVHAVAGAKEYVVDDARGAVVEFEL